MRQQRPALFTNDQYMNLSSSFRIFKHQIQDKVDVHCHEFYELAFVTAGTGKQIVNGNPSIIEKGTMFFLTPADFHEIIPNQDSVIHLYNLIFSGDMINNQVTELLFSVRRSYIHCFEDHQYIRMRSDWDRIWEEAQVSKVGAQMILQGAIERVLIDLYRECHTQGSSPESRMSKNATDTLLRNSTIYIQHRFRESITLEQVAKHYGLSPNYFSECFKQVLGISFQNYVVNTRLDFAKSLLKVSNMTITEICLSSGFNTLSHFEKMFKKKFSVTPKSYRSHHSIDL